MREISQSLKQRMDKESLSLCRLVELTLTNGVVCYYTDLSSDIKYAGKSYKSEPGVEISAIRQSLQNAASSCNIVVAYDESNLTEEGVRYGIADNAKVVIKVIDYQFKSAGDVVIFSGIVSLAELNELNTCDLTISSSAVDSSAVTIGEVYSQRCRNVFGDKRCKINLDALKVPFTVIRASGNSMSFYIADPGDFPSEDQTDPTPSPYTSGEMTYNQAGSYDFVIPKCQSIVVELLSSSGGSGSSVQNALNTRVQSYIDGIDGTSAMPTLFGQWELPGGYKGQGGIANAFDLGPNFPVKEATIINKSNLRKPVTPALLPDGLNYLLAKTPPFSEVLPQGGAPSVLGLPYVGIPGSEGGDSGAGHKGVIRIDMASLTAPLVGSTVTVVVGEPGKGGGYDGTPGGNYLEGQDGNTGSVKIIWSSNNEIIDQDGTIAKQPYSIGTIEWTEGRNKGFYNQIAAKDKGFISLMSPPARQIRSGDKGFITPGCSNYADMCENVWNNLINMQAEPVVPQGQSAAPVPVTTSPTDTTKPIPYTDFSGGPSLLGNPFSQPGTNGNTDFGNPA